MLRSCGQPYDLRKNEPYEIYSDIDFKIPFGFTGDCFDRYLIRIEEMRQSIAIILQSINKIPKGPIKSTQSQTTAPVRSALKSSMEELINHFNVYSKGFKVKNNNSYVAVEAPKGELGVYAVTLNSNRPYRAKIKSPGFYHLQAFDFMSKNHLIADAVTIIGTQDIVFGEVDR
jgi:NADH:ubiquinone oxidoreductase subunit D